MKRIFQTVLLLILTWVSYTAAAAFSIEYQAPADPTTAGFSAQVVSGPAPGVNEPIANDLGVPAWSISESDLGSQFGYQSGPLSAEQKADLASEGFTLTLRGRALQGNAPAYDAGNNTVIGGALLDVGSKRYDLWLGINSSGNTVAVLLTSFDAGPGGSLRGFGPSYTLSDAGYHTYQLVFDPNTQSASLFVDGIERISGYTGHSQATDVGLYFGIASGGGMNFNLVRLTSPVADLHEGLVAWWPLDGNAVDASGNGNDGQVLGPVPCEDRFGNPGGAMCFDGDLAQYINIGNRVKPPFPFTITAWVKPDTIDGSKFIIRNDLWSYNYHGAVVHIINGRLGGVYGDGGWNAPYSRTGALTEEGVMVAGDWQHVAVVFNAHRDIRLYRNCMEHQVVGYGGTGSSIQYSAANGALGLGSPLAGNAQNYTGVIDGVRVYNRALSSVEMAGLCQEGPNWFGNTLQTRSNYEFSIEQYTPKTDSIQLFNPGNVTRSATLEILNPHSDLTVSLPSSDPVSIAAGETKTVDIAIDPDSLPIGEYDGILLKVAVDDGSTLYSNIKVHIVSQGAGNLPDLTLRSDDIGFTVNNPGDPVTLTATIRNQGSSPAANVSVQFYEFDTLLGETVITEVPTNAIANTSITFPMTASGDHLVRVVIDPFGAIEELDETNNEASQIVQPGGSPGPTEGNILVTGSLPTTVYTDSLFTLTGRAVYDITVDGTRYTNYVVKGGLVQITIQGDGGAEWVYGNIHTDVNGNFTKYLQAPSSPGTYRIRMTVTDQTFLGTRELVFSVEERPATPPPPPAAPCTDCSGSWSYDALTGTWTWTWTNPPANEPAFQSDVRVFSENIHFSNNHPDPNEEITIFSEIQYWATSTNSIAQNVPVNFYVTYPGTPRVEIGQTLIPSLSVGAPDFGSRYVYTTWKNSGDGIYLVETEIDPSYVEANRLNNAATRAIIVGEVQSQHGVIAGQVTDPLGGFGNVILRVIDTASGAEIGNAITDSTGFYLVENIPVGEMEVRIEPPTGYQPDAETKTATVADQAVSTVDFSLSRQTATAFEIELSPATAVNDLGLQEDDHTVTARIIDSQGTPQPNLPVTFTVSGVNDGAMGVCDPADCSTDADGQTRFTYSNSARIKGSDSITASYTNPAGDILTSPAVTKNWIMPCDQNDDGQIDRNDVNIIFAGRGQNLPGDPRDIDGDGWITVNDGRACVLQCTNANCAP